jgi:hypothetical protein
MRLLLLVVFSFISFVAFSQAPPMAIGGNQGISVKRILAQDWMSVPIMADTPVSPLTGSGWPGKGYLVFVAKNPDSVCVGCPPADTSLWEYTGARWKRVGMDYLTKLVYGGDVGRQTNRRYFVTPYAAFINGNYYTTINNTNVTTAAKTADSTSRIDVIVITTSGPTVKVGIPNKIPFKPPVAGDEIELSTIYFPPFDTTAKFIPSTAIGVTNIFRVGGRDSIYFSIDTVTFAIKDSIGISTATNGLTYSDKNVKLGGSFTENTTITMGPGSTNYTLNFTTNEDPGKYLYFNPGDVFNPGNFIGQQFIASSKKNRDDAFFQFIADTGRVMMYASEPSPGSNRKNAAFLVSNRGIIMETDNGFFLKRGNRFNYSSTNGGAVYQITTSDTSSNQLLVFNKTTGLISRYSGAFPGSIPTLEQVTTAGNTTTDSLNIKTPLGKTAVSITSFDFAGAENAVGRVILRNTFDSSELTIIHSGLDRRFAPTDLIKQVRFTNVRNQNSQINFPDSSGTLAQRVKANGVTYSAGFNGVVDIGDYWLSGSATLDFPSTGHGNSADLTFTLTGAAEGDVVALGIPNASIVANGSFIAWVSATNTITVRFNNYAGSGSSDPASGTFKIKVFK